MVVAICSYLFLLLEDYFKSLYMLIFIDQTIKYFDINSMFMHTKF